MFTEEDEVGKYKKKKSNTSSSNKKVKHKHQYKECIVKGTYTYGNKEHHYTNLASYCEVCGKVGCKLENTIVTNYTIKEESATIGTCYRKITEKELLEQYGDKLPIFNVDFNNPYVALNK